MSFKRLVNIMRIQDYNMRVKELAKFGKELGASLTYVGGEIDETEENLAWERIIKVLVVRQSEHAWKIALASAIASMLSALAAWVAIIR